MNIRKVALLFLFFSSWMALTACQSQGKKAVLTFRIEANEPARLQVSLCGQDFDVANAEKDPNGILTANCDGHGLIKVSIEVGGKEFIVAPEDEIYRARRFHVAININNSIVAGTVYSAAFCKNQNELCGQHYFTGYRSRSNGKYIRDPDSPLLSEAQRHDLRQTLSQIKATQ